MAENTSKKSVFGFLKKNAAIDEIQSFIDLIKKEPENDRHYIRLAELYARAGDEEGAVSTYEKVALLFEKKGFFNKAKAVLKQALSINPDHGKVNVLLADLDKQDGLIKDAVLRYQIAANYYAKAGNRLAAINILKKIVDIYPDNISYLLKLANLLVAEKMNNEAQNILMPLSVRLKSGGSSDDYLAVLKLLYSATENSASIGKDLVNAYINSKNFPSALAILHKLVLNEPESRELLEKLAFVFDKLGEKDKLISTYKQLAVIHNKSRNIDAANQIYRKILEISSSDTEALLALNKESKLRDMIESKISKTTADINAQDIDESDDITIDMELSDDEGVNLIEEDDYDDAVDADSSSSKKSSTQQGSDYNVSAIIKESKVYKTYKLFDKAVAKLKSFPSWNVEYDVLDLLSEIFIEIDNMEMAREHLGLLLDLMISKGEIEKAATIFMDVEPIMVKHSKFQFYQTSLSQPLSKSEESVDTWEKDILTQIDIAEEKEDLDPPAKLLEELEFFLNMEDYSSAMLLLQDLLAKYPDSEMLRDFRELIPSKKEEDISNTLSQVKTNLSETMKGAEKTAEDFYNMGIVHHSMTMTSDAVSYFKQAVSKDMSNIKYLIALSDAYRDMEHFDKSTETLEKAIEVSPSSEIKIDLLEKVATLYYHVKNLEKYNNSLLEIKKLKR